MKMSNARAVGQKASTKNPPKIPPCTDLGQSLKQLCIVSLSAQMPSPHTGKSTHFLVSTGLLENVPHWFSSPQRRPCTPPEHELQPLQTHVSTHSMLCWPKTVPAKNTAAAKNKKNNSKFFEKNNFSPIIIGKTSILIKPPVFGTLGQNSLAFLQN